MKKIKRVAGASAGAITAALIAIGFDSQELKDFLDQDLKKILVGKKIVHWQLIDKPLSSLSELFVFRGRGSWVPMDPISKTCLKSSDHFVCLDFLMTNP